MSGECSNCESRQRRGNDPRCLVCIYFNSAIFNKGFTNVKSQHFITKVEKAIENAKVFRDKAKTADLRLKVKDVDEILNLNNNSRTFQEIFDDKKEHWQKLELNVADICGFEDAHKEVSEVHESDKGNFYFTFPCSTRLRNKYVRIYGTDISTRAAIEKMYPDTDYVQYDSVEWNTPNKYTHRKPCDCYTEWI